MQSTQDSRNREIRHTMKRQTQSGSVLIAVLAILFLLSLVIMRFLDDTVERLEYKALFRPAESERLLAYSYLEATLAVLQEIALLDEGRLHAPAQGWQNPLNYPGFPSLPRSNDVRITVVDESGLLPLHRLDADMLNALFEEMEIPPSRIPELTDSLLDWIDEDSERRLSGAESPDYLSGRNPHRAADGPLQSFAELRLINGFREQFFDPDSGQPNDLYRQLVSAVSLQHMGRVNLNAAPDLVLRTLARMEGWDPKLLWDGLDQPYLIQLPGAINQALAASESSLLRITVAIQQGEQWFRISALVVPAIDVGQSAAASALPGRAISEDQRRSGTAEEHNAIRYPFRVFSVTEANAINGSPAVSALSQRDSL
jgi:type II secretory pathway component PulK